MTTPDVDVALLRDMRRQDFLIKKEAVPCVIMTTKNLIEGDLHKRGTYRILDEMNTSNQFIAVTNAKVYGGQSTEALEADFIALRTDQVVWVKPNSPAKEPT
jgi:hypothetical protein